MIVDNGLVNFYYLMKFFNYLFLFDRSLRSVILNIPNLTKINGYNPKINQGDIYVSNSLFEHFRYTVISSNSNNMIVESCSFYYISTTSISSSVKLNNIISKTFLAHSNEYCFELSHVVYQNYYCYSIVEASSIHNQTSSYQTSLYTRSVQFYFSFSNFTNSVSSSNTLFTVESFYYYSYYGTYPSESKIYFSNFLKNLATDSGMIYTSKSLKISNVNFIQNNQLRSQNGLIYGSGEVLFTFCFFKENSPLYLYSLSKGLFDRCYIDFHMFRGSPINYTNSLLTYNFDPNIFLYITNIEQINSNNENMRESIVPQYNIQNQINTSNFYFPYADKTISTNGARFEISYYESSVSKYFFSFSIFSGLTSNKGGAVYFFFLYYDSSIFLFEYSSFYKCFASEIGGAIYIHNTINYDYYRGFLIFDKVVAIECKSSISGQFIEIDSTQYLNFFFNNSIVSGSDATSGNQISPFSIIGSITNINNFNLSNHRVYYISGISLTHLNVFQMSFSILDNNKPVYSTLIQCNNQNNTIKYTNFLNNSSPNGYGIIVSNSPICNIISSHFINNIGVHFYSFSQKIFVTDCTFSHNFTNIVYGVHSLYLNSIKNQTISINIPDYDIEIEKDLSKFVYVTEFNTFDPNLLNYTINYNIPSSTFSTFFESDSDFYSIYESSDYFQEETSLTSYISSYYSDINTNPTVTNYSYMITSYINTETSINISYNSTTNYDSSYYYTSYYNDPTSSSSNYYQTSTYNYSSYYDYYQTSIFNYSQTSTYSSYYDYYQTSTYNYSQTSTYSSNYDYYSSNNEPSMIILTDYYWNYPTNEPIYYSPPVTYNFPENTSYIPPPAPTPAEFATNFFSGSFSPITLQTNRIINISNNFYLLDSLFYNLLSEQGSAIYCFSSNEIKLVIEFCTFTLCRSNGLGGAITFNCPTNGGIVISQTCAHECSTPRSHGQFSYIYSSKNQLSMLHYLSINKCSNVVSTNSLTSPIYLLSGQQGVISNNISGNFVYHVSGIYIKNPNQFIMTFTTFYRNYAKFSMCLYLWGNNGNIKNCNFIENHSPSRSVISNSYSNTIIELSIFYNNHYNLFGNFYNGELKLINCFIQNIFQTSGNNIQFISNYKFYEILNITYFNTFYCRSTN